VQGCCKLNNKSHAIASKLEMYCAENSASANIWQSTVHVSATVDSCDRGQEKAVPQNAEFSALVFHLQMKEA
jgi:hypothetical protein